MRISIMQVGVGAAIWSGLLLTFIGHPQPTVPMISAVPAKPAAFALKSVSVELPTSDVVFPGPANATAITANCLACHSAGMVLTQPMLSKAAWTGIVEKMIHAYKAPVSESDVPAIVDYLQDIKVTR